VRRRPETGRAPPAAWKWVGDRVDGRDFTLNTLDQPGTRCPNLTSTSRQIASSPRFPPSSSLLVQACPPPSPSLHVVAVLLRLSLSHTHPISCHSIDIVDRSCPLLPAYHLRLPAIYHVASSLSTTILHPSRVFTVVVLTTFFCSVNKLQHDGPLDAPALCRTRQPAAPCSPEC
jgi:hypothetical protein